MSSQRRPRLDEQPSQTYSIDRPNTFTKLDLKPRRYHAFYVLLFIFGTIFPPLAVAARFGIGTDFWLNLLLTICGWVPGQIHNFFVQNIRNNKNHRRTPKWAVRYGLVDDSDLRRRAKRSQWATRYNERLPQSTLEGQAYAEDQIPDRTPSENPQRERDERGLWNATEDETYYGQRRGDGGSLESNDSASAGRRWRFPANFDDAEASNDSPRPSTSKSGKKKKKDRWELSEEARLGVLPEEGKKKKKRSKKRPEIERNVSLDSYVEPEDPVGGLYGDRRRTQQNPEGESERRDRELFEHEF